MDHVQTLGPTVRYGEVTITSQDAISAVCNSFDYFREHPTLNATTGTLYSADTVPNLDSSGKEGELTLNADEVTCALAGLRILVEQKSKQAADVSLELALERREEIFQKKKQRVMALTARAIHLSNVWQDIHEAAQLKQQA